GNGLGVPTHLHLSASLPNAPWIELLQDPPALEIDEFQGLLAVPLAPDADGYVRVPEGPGLGVELHERWSPCRPRPVPTFRWTASFASARSTSRSGCRPRSRCPF